MTQFWWNFTCSCLGTSRTDSNYQVDIYPGNICPGDICPNQKHLSCYWPDVDPTFFLPTFFLTFIFGPNFKQRVQGTYTTDYKCHHDICPGNICPGDICPNQQYLSCYWPDLDQTLNKGSWEHIQQIRTVTATFVRATFVLGTFVQISNISAVTGPIWIKL